MNTVFFTDATRSESPSPFKSDAPRKLGNVCPNLKNERSTQSAVAVTVKNSHFAARALCYIHQRCEVQLAIAM